jgi:hypothetical protein
VPAEARGGRLTHKVLSALLKSSRRADVVCYHETSVSKDQVVFVAAAFVILAVITVAAQFHWLPSGRPKTVIVFVAGVASVVAR